MTVEIRHRTLPLNGIDLHIAEAGTGPLVVMCHGFPELWYSWRHQLRALAEAGFHAVAPDMRGYGGTSAPHDIASYTILHLVGDVVALVEALGEKRALMVGHDWGAVVAWHAAQIRPDIFPAVAALSVPHTRRGRTVPIGTLRKAGKADYYWVYFQEPGVAEAELERDARFSMRRILIIGAGDTPREHKLSLYVDPTQGFLGSSQEQLPLPPWLSEVDLDVFADAFARSGFRGGLNWYRNLDRNWELLAPWDGAVIAQPALFIAGASDVTITGSVGARALEAMDSVVPRLERKLLLEGAGHWIQQERPAEVNAALIEFAREHLV
jgi:pimeloyl-ACP methyl ester carboxylesterase